MSEIKLWQGDCLELMKDIPNKSIDMILCDLPYGTTKCKWDIIIPFDKLWEQYKRIIKDNGVILLFGSEPFSSNLRLSNFDWFKYDLYWIKNKPSDAMLAKKQPMRAVETISVFYKNQPTYNPQMIPRTEAELKRLSKKSVVTIGTEVDGRAWGMSGNRTDNKMKYPTNVLNFKTVFNRSKEKLPHPTQKPIDMCEWLVKTYSNVDDTVLDNCTGTATVGVACQNLNRNFIGIELDENYFNIAKERLKNNELLLKEKYNG